VALRKGIRILEEKYELFCKDKFGISFIEKDYEASKENVRR
jgi:hypothetical protein